MNKIYNIALWSLLFLSFSTSNFAQHSEYSGEQIIGKWNLRSASFNGKDVHLNQSEQGMSFEFTNNGLVMLFNSDGLLRQGQYVIEDDRLIDPNSPEYLNAHIISLSNDELILSMYEDHNEVLMIFELEGFASK
jgi:hypothetical protein